MASLVKVEIIGIVHSPFKEKFGIPRGSHLCPSTPGKIEIQPPYNHPQAFTGLETFQYIWIIFKFHKATLSPNKLTVRPPRLGGEKRLGIFATRSPHRPNAIGQSVVRLKSISHESGKLILHILGHDFLDQTPIWDIRPYLPESDFIPNANQGWCQEKDFLKMKAVHFSSRVLEKMQLLEYQVEDVQLESYLLELLTHDPRPSHQKEKKLDKVYVFHIFHFDLHFSVCDNLAELTVSDLVIK